MKLEGRVCIVTGASRGIGKAIALAFAREGANVVIAARTEAEKPKLPGTIHKTAQEIQALGRRALAVKCDVSDEHDVEEMVQKTIGEFGRVDVLVNNAGVAFWRPVVEMPAKRWDLVIEVNLRGTFLCTKAVLPKMIEQESGSIINMSSKAAWFGRPINEGLAYCAAKAAIERFSNGLAEEVREHNIAVNCYMPLEGVATEGLEYWLSKEDFSKLKSPDLMCKVAVFLATQDATGVTGEVATDADLLRKYYMRM